MYMAFYGRDELLGCGLKRAPDSSVRAALVYDGVLVETVQADGYFDAIIPFRRLLGL